jgi:hypothetical protein
MSANGKSGRSRSALECPLLTQSGHADGRFCHDARPNGLAVIVALGIGCHAVQRFDTA